MPSYPTVELCQQFFLPAEAEVSDPSIRQREVRENLQRLKFAVLCEAQKSGAPAKLTEIDIEVQHEHDHYRRRDRFILTGRWPAKEVSAVRTVRSTAFSSVAGADPSLATFVDEKIRTNVALLQSILDEALPHWRDVYDNVEEQQRAEATVGGDA